MEEITVYILDNAGKERALQIPLGFSMSLMEALKAYEEPLEATCGGMALCATCHVEIVSGFDETGNLTDDEEAMLDTLPMVMDSSRLSCQIKVSPLLNGLRIRYVDSISA